jgi:hypothetical protein
MVDALCFVEIKRFLKNFHVDYFMTKQLNDIGSAQH